LKSIFFGNFLFLEEEKYLNKIKDNIKEVIINKKRSALLISNLIAKGKEFYDILFNENIENVIQYFNEDDNSTIQNVLDIWKIIMTTNLTWRGIVIKISNELEKNDGLNVIVSFLPLNQRIEDQNYVREGRKRKKCSHNIIML